MWLIALGITFGGVGAGYLAWHEETLRLYRRDEETHPGMSAREYERCLMRKRRRRRLVKTGLYAIGGAAAGFGLLMVFALRR